MGKVFSIDSKKPVEKAEQTDDDPLSEYKEFVSEVERDIFRLVKGGYKPDIFLLSIGLQHPEHGRVRDFFLRIDGTIHTQESIIGLIEMTKNRIATAFEAMEDEDDGEES